MSLGSMLLYNFNVYHKRGCDINYNYCYYYCYHYYLLSAGENILDGSIRLK
jgi:hypothetical protein